MFLRIFYFALNEMHLFHHCIQCFSLILVDGERTYFLGRQSNAWVYEMSISRSIGLACLSVFFNIYLFITIRSSKLLVTTVHQNCNPQPYMWMVFLIAILNQKIHSLTMIAMFYCSLISLIAWLVQMRWHLRIMSSWRRQSFSTSSFKIPKMSLPNLPQSFMWLV